MFRLFIASQFLLTFVLGGGAQAQSALETVLFIAYSIEPGTVDGSSNEETTTLKEIEGNWLTSSKAIATIFNHDKPEHLYERFIVEQKDKCNYVMTVETFSRNEKLDKPRFTYVESYDFSGVRPLIEYYKRQELFPVAKVTGLKQCLLSHTGENPLRGAPVGGCATTTEVPVYNRERFEKAMKHFSETVCRYREF